MITNNRTPFSNLKDNFKRDMKFIYPEGLEDSDYQFRDVVRVYTMAWMSSLMNINARNSVSELVDDYKLMVGVDWMPDDSWKWW